jgi:hypothetical protein
MVIYNPASPADAERIKLLIKQTRKTVGLNVMAGLNMPARTAAGRVAEHAGRAPNDRRGAKGVSSGSAKRPKAHR